MEQLVRVHKTFDDGTAQVVCIRQSACSGDCHKCSGCGAAQEAVVFTAYNPIGAKPNDFVNVHSDTAPVLKAAAVLYLIPLVLFFLGYYLGTLPGRFGVLGGCLGFVLGIAIVVMYDRMVMKKANMDYTITALAGKTLLEAQKREGHNHG